MSLLLNAVFHHSLMMIPQQEIPGTVPKAYVMKHPITNSVEVKQKALSRNIHFIQLNSFKKNKNEFIRFGGHPVRVENVQIKKKLILLSINA